MSKITAEQYEAAVGHAPEHDDLERSNCDKAGEICHTQCGWDHERNLPEFIAAAYRFKEQLDAGNAIDLLRPGYTPDTLYDEEAASRYGSITMSGREQATLTEEQRLKICQSLNCPINMTEAEANIWIITHQPKASLIKTWHIAAPDCVRALYDEELKAQNERRSQT